MRPIDADALVAKMKALDIWHETEYQDGYFDGFNDGIAEVEEAPTIADLDLIRKAINFAMSELCDGYLDMPSGCGGCPLCDYDNLDEDGNTDCRGDMFRRFIKKMDLEET